MFGGVATRVSMPRADLPGFSFFSFTPIGLAVLVLGVLYMLATRHWLQRDADSDASAPPRLTLADLADNYRLSERERRLQVRADSPLANQALDELQLRSQYGINVIAVERQRQFRTLLLMATGNTQLQPGDVLLVDLASPAIGLLGAYQELGLEALPLRSSYYSVLSLIHI